MKLAIIYTYSPASLSYKAPLGRESGLDNGYLTDPSSGGLEYGS